MKQKSKLFLLVLLAGVLTLSACTGKKEKTQENTKATAKKGTFTVTDIKGRQVHFNKVPEKVVTIGHGALKYYTYVCGDKNLVGIEEAEKKGHSVKGQSIHHAYPNLKNIKSVGNGGPKLSPNYENLAFVKPDVIFAAYETSKEDFDKLQEKTKVPVVAIGTIMKGNIFDKETYDTFSIIGKTMQKEKRANEIIQTIKDVESDLKKRSEGISKPLEAYIGATTFKGPQGILSTKTKLDLLKTVGVKNVMDKITNKRSIILDKEKLLEINPKLMLLDMSGKTPLLEDMKKDPTFYKKLEAFKTGKVYGLMPYFTYGMNYDTALINMYYIGKLAYPEKYQDIDIEKKAREIYTKFVGKDVFDSMKKVHPESFKEFKIHE
ncbi:ABC transporter substrate-binding protein [Bulleidia extructa]|uniref:ABC transporter substrate-binding protein n=1 Tax=Bulleidia extructa TaxID=118748 RepID=UPI003BF191B7